MTVVDPLDLPIRYYLHGDLSETSLKQYYCFHCNLFQGQDHFEGSHGANAQRLALRFLRAWQKNSVFDTRVRPQTAVNLWL